MIDLVALEADLKRNREALEVRRKELYRLFDALKAEIDQNVEIENALYECILIISPSLDKTT